MKRMILTILGMLLLAAGTSGCVRPAWAHPQQARTTVTDSVFGSVYPESVFDDLYGPSEEGKGETIVKPSGSFETGIGTESSLPTLGR
ncbi:hypothetical protein BG53_02220 [Paenibacillus darwinianus]|uniref:Uncharacterized protein n=1 Tax=Paenibacillus darwinianus TaxID=1380763 RepID=A0A9W5W7K8_9BACL|nr:hypothetical protein [Paenibacillus darwinianus]EXX85577.1 hypothetical protein BG52_08175 [Paenibacillus darwinianus]EXX88315.1 hypothetical protein BG53_02220 [Paenibacillus darwinianus]EXX89848.1 hypothetical protein CH50_00735 [Paenibacillus darwinianus]